MIRSTVVISQRIIMLQQNTILLSVIRMHSLSCGHRYLLIVIIFTYLLINLRFNLKDFKFNSCLGVKSNRLKLA